MAWDRASDSLAEVLLTIQRILLPWVHVSETKARHVMETMETEDSLAGAFKLLLEVLEDDEQRKELIRGVKERLRDAMKEAGNDKR